MADETKEAKILKFKKKTVVQETSDELLASVFLENDLIGVEIKDGLILLSPANVVQLIIILTAALQAHADNTKV